MATSPIFRTGLLQWVSSKVYRDSSSGLSSSSSPGREFNSDLTLDLDCDLSDSVWLPSSPSPTARRSPQQQDVADGKPVSPHYPTVPSQAAGPASLKSPDPKMTTQNGGGQGANITLLVQGQPEVVDTQQATHNDSPEASASHKRNGNDSLLGHSRQGSESLLGHSRQGSDSLLGHSRQGSDSLLGHSRQGSDSLGHRRQGSDSQKSNGSDMVIMTPITDPDDLALLAKLDAANKLLESDEKSLRSLSNTPSKQSSQSGHSRKGSVSSVMSSNSVSSNISNLQYEEESNNPDDAWVIWGKLVNDWESISKKKPVFIKELVRKGVPHHFRGIVWQLLCNAHISDAKEAYAEYLKMTSPYEKVIRRDITRTYPEHDFFKEKNGLGQESLFNVMKAYSLHDREVGYCQGSGFIVGLLLMQMPEEEAFAVLVKLMQEYRLRELFKPSMAELGLCMFQLECMIQEHLPDLYMHFQSQNFCVSMFASSWFLTLFTTSLPLSVACRIFDVFLSEGMETVFRVGYSILQINHDDLMSQDMEGMLKFLQKEMPTRHEQDTDTLLTTSFNAKYNTKKMKKLEKEYNALKTKEQEDQVELRRLRTENRLLRQRIDNLEKETATLADRLIQDQVIRAQKEEEIFVLRRELATIKQQDAETREQLQRIKQEFQEHKEKESVVTSTATQESRKVEELSKELTELKEREQEAESTMRQLNDKIRELENTNRQLQKEPSIEIQQLQEELIAAKLREAEANLSMKELRQRVTDLDKHWQKHMEKANAPEEGEKKPSKKREQQIADDLMAVRLREAEALADLKEMKQKVMELETQNQICSRQIKRMDDERTKLQDKLEEAADKEKDHARQLQDLERKETDQDSKRKEDIMMSRIKDAEHSQMIAEMRQRIAELEIENQELVTAGQLQERGETQELENRIADLQEEVMQLKMAKRLQSISSLALNHITLDTESDYDTDDMESTLTDTHKLKLSDGLTSIVADSHRLKLKDLDSSEGEGLYDFDDGTIKRRTSKKKKRSGSKPLVLEPVVVDDKDSQLKREEEEKEKDGASSGVSSAGSTSTETPSCSTSSSSSQAVDCEPIANGDVLPPSPHTPNPAKPAQTCDTEATTNNTTTSSLNGAPPTTKPNQTVKTTD